MNNLVRLEVNLKNISHNIFEIKKFTGQSVGLIAVVKSEAYGHGLVPVARALAGVGVEMLAVTSAPEAFEVYETQIKKPILILGGLNPLELERVVKDGFAVTVFDLELCQALNRVAQRQGATVPVHIKVDTGMNRLGVSVEDFIDFIKLVNKLDRLKIEGIFTHFADSAGDQISTKDYTLQQLERFNKALMELQALGQEIPIIHAANSITTFLYPRAHYDMVRPGIALYGYSPFGDCSFSQGLKKNHLKVKLPALKPIGQLKCQIIQVKEIPAGSLVSYGCTFKTKRATKIAVVPIGYFEGLPRAASNIAEVLVGGKRCPIIGRVCMNYTIVDVTFVPTKVRRGDEAVIFGQQGREEITVEELAGRCDTINYEIITRIGPGVERVYIT